MKTDDQRHEEIMNRLGPKPKADDGGHFGTSDEWTEMWAMTPLRLLRDNCFQGILQHNLTESLRYYGVEC